MLPSFRVVLVGLLAWDAWLAVGSVALEVSSMGGVASVGFSFLGGTLFSYSFASCLLHLSHLLYTNAWFSYDLSRFLYYF